MTRLLSFFTALSLGILVALGTGQSARAMPTLIVDGGGQLLGADNVDLGGLGVFDVRFLEGTCAGLFSGCNNAAEDFAFQNIADATTAAQALLDQVFVDGVAGNFDTDPGQIFGCAASVSDCQALIPALFTGLVVGVRSRNGLSEPADRVTNDFSTTSSLDTSIINFANYAVFTPASTTAVPEPSALLIVGAGLFCVATAKRRRSRR